MHSRQLMLIVDDKRVNRFTLRTIFENDFEIVECANGNEAIDFLQNNKQKPSIILLDIIMPECDGFEVLNFMKQNDIQEIPVVFITASDDETQIKKGFNMNVADFIHKPFDEDVVKNRVRHVLGFYR